MFIEIYHRTAKPSYKEFMELPAVYCDAVNVIEAEKHRIDKIHQEDATRERRMRNGRSS